MIELHLGDCLNVLRSMPEMSVDAIVTDPPYGLSFMGKKWDYDVPSVEIWKECLRVLKPGGHLLSFAGTRTQHRMAVNIEDAGFQIRDLIFYCYGQGFPKSLNVSKAIDKMAGAEREVLSSYEREGRSAGILGNKVQIIRNITAPATESARQWNGWGTALKPSLEPVTVARRPIIGTVAENVLKYGTGGINVDGCRVGTETITARKGGFSDSPIYGTGTAGLTFGGHTGRFPANFIHDGSDEVVGLFPDTGGDSGSAVRFFYCAKCSKSDREGSTHPTMKPTALMRYLCRLVTPPGGIVLDPFMGSGSTGKAAVLEGFNFIGIEREPEYMEIARRRIHAVQPKPEPVNDLVTYVQPSLF